MVRQTLGDDAIIVATREESGGKAVRVTAAVEQEDRYAAEPFEDDMQEQYQPPQRRQTSAPQRATDSARDSTRDPFFEIETVSEPAAADDWLQYDQEEEEDAVVEQLTDAMLRHSVPDEITDQILSCATVIGLNSADQALVAALEHLYSFRPLPQKAARNAMMVVGPPGAGKTLAVAKIAARGVMNGLNIAVVTTDTIRAGGVEQLSAFTKLMRVNLQKAETPKDLRAAIEAVKGADQILIDTGGMNPFSTTEMRDLARLIAAGDIDPLLVMPGGIDADESGEMARVYATLGVRSLLPTRLDIARRLGGLLGAAHHGGLIFADASNTAKVADGLIQLSPVRLAQILMPQGRNNRNQSSRQQAKAKAG